MVSFEQLGELILVTAPDYTVTMARDDGRFARVDQRSFCCDLFIPAACDADGRSDINGWVSPPLVDQEGDAVRIVVEAGSPIWAMKRYDLLCQTNRIEYLYFLEGQGRLENAAFYIGNGPAERSKPGFRSVFNPGSNSDKGHYLRPNEYATIVVPSNRSNNRGDASLTPGPFVYALESPDGWIAAAIGTEPEAFLFTEFEYTGLPEGFGFNLRYDGLTNVDGQWLSPTLALIFGAGSEHAAVEAGSDWARAGGFASPSSIRPG